MMLSAAAARRTSSAFLRTHRTPRLPSRFIAFSTHLRPLQHQPIFRNFSLYTQTQSTRPVIPRHVSNVFQQTRSLSRLQRLRLDIKQACKGIWRKNPIFLPFTLFLLSIASLGLAYAIWLEVTHYVPKLHDFPPEVARELRQALFYTEIDLQPREAVKHFNLALKAAQEAGMHKFSDEVLGIRLTAVDMMEKAGVMGSAIASLEKTKRDILEWVEEGRKEAAKKKEEHEKHAKTLQELKAKKEEAQRKSPTAVQPKLEIDNPDVVETYEKMQENAKWEETQRDKGIKKAVGISIKLADLYDSDHIQDSKKAEAAREAAVDISMKELAYREASGLPVSGGNMRDGEEADSKFPYLTRSEVAMTLLDLAQAYSMSDKEDLAISLWFRSAELLQEDEGGKPSCQQVSIITNIATVTGKHSLRLRMYGNEEAQALAAKVMDNGSNMAKLALEVTNKIPETERDELCHSSCVVAKHILGEFFEAQGKIEEAKKWYKGALTTAERHRAEGTAEFVSTTKEAYNDILKKSKGSR
ncbi:TPR domain protein [Aspergillus undulatus]|uniref:TPR domain protein n=1 Tax=Aspergillus undulatus TaxID=1810928 RepID=UPI003CCD5504